ncbi:hypothetical protein Goshw_004533 [Gossypium schwendimanii]|uniref:DUF7745 domain-containing protein n=1 Tax=Gossypium schwendimanii TaxID=34291 RepID=A0A7J9N6K6_GOSSC|nr:hypothetical protein [Gossypium schwendimanii]
MKEIWDKYLFRALAQFWNPAYSCFTFGKVDLIPTVEEYTTLLRCQGFRSTRFILELLVSLRC